ncbi:hypothetical protein V6N11_007728 [Hibiscus sabdariffa]|uniref:Protein kinase domain-containing protein n=2 Tax=Hibiscus sabdariffa TaxID=183260 RepID=A0ABR2BQA6_9ROSI
MLESPGETSEEDIFLESLTGMLTRFTYNDLWSATNNLSIKLGQGGFGSVYRGTLPDGTQLAVKKLEGIGQGTISSQEEGKLRDILDSRLSIEGEDERVYTAIKSCILVHTGRYAFKAINDQSAIIDRTIPASAPSVLNGDAYFSAVRLSGPR